MRRRPGEELGVDIDATSSRYPSGKCAKFEARVSSGCSLVLCDDNSQGRRGR